MERPRLSVSARLARVPLAFALAACGADPRPAPPPPPQPVVAEPEPAPAPEPTPAPAVTISLGSFSQELRERLQPGDYVEVDAHDGAAARGWLRHVRSRSLAFADAPGEDGAVTRRTPEEVAEVRTLFRRVPGTDLAPPPPSPAESWLPEFAPGQVLGRAPAELWTGRFARSSALVVARPISLPALRFMQLTSRAFFVEATEPVVLERYDQVKLTGIAVAYRRTDAGEQEIGPVHLLLVRRGRSVFAAHVTQALPATHLDPRSVERWTSAEPTTAIHRRPGGPPLAVRRVPAGTAAAYRRHLDEVPDRAGMRRLRAKGGPPLVAAERRLEAIYKAFGLERSADLDQPLVVELELALAAETVGWVRYSKEIGLD